MADLKPHYCECSDRYDISAAVHCRTCGWDKCVYCAADCVKAKHQLTHFNGHEIPKEKAAEYVLGIL